MKARYYDSFVGRFLTGDSKIYPKQVNGLNRYMYTNGNPIKYNDPTCLGKQTPYLGAAVVYMLSAGMSERERLLLRASAFAEFRGIERGKQSWLEKTSEKNSSHLGKPHITKLMQYLTASYIQAENSSEREKVQIFALVFTMGKKAGLTWNEIEGYKNESNRISNSWKMAFAAYLVSKDHPNKEIIIISAFQTGKNKDFREKQDMENNCANFKRILYQGGRLLSISPAMKYGIPFSDQHIVKSVESVGLANWGAAYLKFTGWFFGEAMVALGIGFIIVAPMYLVNYLVNNEHWEFTP